MKRQDFEKLPDDLKTELNKITFLPIDERNTQLKLTGAKTVRNTIVKIMVEEEIERRVKLIHSAYAELNKKVKEYVKIAPDMDGDYSVDMVQGPRRYSAKLGKEKLSLFNEMVALKNALNKALAEQESDFSDLEKLIK